jgi:hypothetical protein
MPTLQETTDAIDAAFAGLVGSIQQQQEAYRAARGRYFQGLWSHAAPPADGASAVPDQLTAHPDYQAESWADMQGFPATTQARACCDQYRGPAGEGYVFTMQLLWQGTLWQRAVNFGPEDYRDDGWAPSA